MSGNKYNHLFGPVPSRRLGKSLGVDLVPFKTCSFDCIFCQLGKTTQKTVERKEYVPVDEIIAELDHWLKNGGKAEYITLAGSGEPTLHSGLGRIIDFLHENTEIPVALLTNGALLGDPDVRTDAAKADLVKASLSVWDQSSLEYINRPHSTINFERLIEGEIQFRQHFTGQLWIEVFLVWGANTTIEDVAKIAEWVKEIRPDRVQLNTAVRPPCEEYVQAVPKDIMTMLASKFDPAAEIIAEYSSSTSPEVKANEADILSMLERRPCTLEQICQVFSLHKNEVLKYLGKMMRSGQIQQHKDAGETFYLKR